MQSMETKLATLSKFHLALISAFKVPLASIHDEETKYVELFEILLAPEGVLSHERDVNVKNRLGQSALHIAARLGFANLCRELCTKHGAD